jgi:putative Mg2+ transporter-C (MgtC) family protein
MITHQEMILRIAIGAIMGGVIGFERDYHGRQVGLRTHLIVAMAAATFMVLSAHFAYFQHYGDHPLVEVDSSRIAASVVSGIGFLAGGAILKTGLTIQGLTTAAGLWLVTSIGLCAGAGMYVESGAVTLMGLIALTVLRRFEDKNDRLVERHVTLVFEENPETVPNVMNTMTNLKTQVSHFSYQKELEERTVKIEFDAKIPETVATDEFIRKLEIQAGLKKIEVAQRRFKGL